MEQTNYNNPKIIVHPASLDALATITWDFARTVLWRHTHFENDDVLLFTSLLREYYADIPAENFQIEAMNRFDCYCERIMAAKVNNWNEATHPCFWLHKMNRNGIVKTKIAHHLEIRARRKDNQEYLEELLFNDPLYDKLINNRFIKVLQYANRNR